jgi:O-acetyl-ADP-ribose deacetylase (regulator of RNase III)
MEEIHADILNEKTGLIVHGVNCRAKMGAGIAQQIRKHYPQVYDDYMSYCTDHSQPQNMLGTVVFTPITDKLVIASAFTQLNYGTHGLRYVSYDAVDQCFNVINRYALEHQLIIKYPKIGVGLGGGHWGIVSTIIEANISEEIRHILFVQ